MFIPKTLPWSHSVEFCLKNFQYTFKFIFTSSLVLKRPTRSQPTPPAHMIMPRPPYWCFKKLLDCVVYTSIIRLIKNNPRFFLFKTFAKSGFVFIFVALEYNLPYISWLFFIFLIYFFTSVNFWNASNIVSQNCTIIKVSDSFSFTI